MSKWTADTLQETARQVVTGEIETSKKQPWMRFSDDRQPGLRFQIYRSGLVSLRAQYRFGKSRPNVTVGHFPKTTLEQARYRTRIVIELAKLGIDVKEGLHERTMREIDEEGMHWRPDRGAAAKSMLDTILRVLNEHEIKMPEAVKRHIIAEVARTK